jgi:hypothetical protein
MGDSLSPNQGKFAALVAGGESHTDAYSKVYKSDKMTRQMCSVEGARVKKVPKVAEAIELMRSQSALGTQLRERVTRSYVLKGLQDEAENVDNPPAVRVRSLELLGRTQAMFTDVQLGGTEKRSSGTVEDDINDRLRAIFPDNEDGTETEAAEPVSKLPDGHEAKAKKLELAVPHLGSESDSFDA